MLVASALLLRSAALPRMITRAAVAAGLLWSLAGPAAAQIAPSLAASRLSGVAPLSVFFDATDTTDPGTTRPFHDLEYRWDFGDPGSGNWSTTVLSKNTAKGPVAAHVFQAPGTYTVALTVLNGTSSAAQSVQITVQDPNLVFSGTNTLCVGNSLPVAGSGGCPAGAAVLASSDFGTAITDNIATHKRILFRRGNTFTSSNTAEIAVDGPGLIGAFGSGAAPVVNATGNNWVIMLSGGGTPGIKDWRVMDLEINGNSGAESIGIHAEGGIDQVTLLRLNIHHVHFGVELSPFVLDYYGGEHRLWDEFAVVDSTIGTIIGAGDAGYGLYLAAQRFSLMGNVLQDSTQAGHILRTPNLVKAVISHNHMSNPREATHTVKLQAVVFQNTKVSPTGFTEQVVMSDNKFTGGAGVDWTVTMGPQDSESDEKVRNVIVERNWFAPHADQHAALMVWAQDVTVRNNIFDVTGTAERIGMVVERRGIEPPPARVQVTNNSFYSGSGGPDFVAMAFVEGSEHVARNNLAYAPGASGPVMIYPGSVGFTASHNTSDAAITTSPSFATNPPSEPAHFALTAGSNARDVGTAVPLYSDYFGNARPQGAGYDLGASEFGSALPDAIVTSLTYANGTFTSVVKNQGAGDLPAGTNLGVAYLVDGVWRTWGGIVLPSALVSGTSITIGTDGGAYVIADGSHTITAYVDDVNRFAESDETNNQFSRTIPVSHADTTNPSGPSGLAATAVSSSRIDLTWNAATDNVGVTGYYVARSGTSSPIATVSGTSYSDTGLPASTAYTYYVFAFDAAGNLSGGSAGASATTLP